jgi:hypothetical protein
MVLQRPRRRVYAAEEQGRWTFHEERLIGVTEVLNQHYVPQFYLKGFLQGARIQGYDLAEGRALRGSVKRIASATGYYDLSLAGYIVSVEDWLAGLENHAAPVVAKLRADPSVVAQLSEEEEDDLARFVAAQWLRGPGFRRWQERTRQSLSEQMGPTVERMAKLAGTTTDQVWQQLELTPDGSIPQDEQLRTQMHMLDEVQGLANQLQAMPWRVGRVMGARRLYTSDNPVARYLTPVRPWWEMCAFPAFQYYFPLSPDVLMRIDPLGDEPKARGVRSSEPISQFETSFARHLVTHDAVRFLYGNPPYVDSACAKACIERISDVRLAIATQYGGFDPNPPSTNVAGLIDSLPDES